LNVGRAVSSSRQVWRLFRLKRQIEVNFLEGKRRDIGSQREGQDMRVWKELMKRKTELEDRSNDQRRRKRRKRWT
jgi:hypothetical protein